MKSAEYVEKPPLHERFPSPAYLEMCRPTETVRSVLDINWHHWVADGRDTLSVDAEGTFVGTGRIHPPGDIIEHFQDARSAGFKNISIQTNMRPNSQAALIKAAWWADQIGADVVFSPRDFSERKPNPAMTFMEGAYFDMSPEEVQQRTLRIGDKLTADILSANLAGIPSVYVADPLGDFDFFGDKLFRRPYERRLYERMQRTKPHQTEPPLFPDDITENPQYKNLHVSDELLPLTEKLAHVGIGPQVALSEKMLALVENRMAEVMLGARIKQQVREVVPERLEALYEGFVGRYGDVAADLATLSRLPIGVEEYYALTKGNPRLAFALKALAGVTDKVDGTWGKGYRKRNPDASKSLIGSHEDFFDKVESVTSERGMVNSVYLSDVNFNLRVARELVMIGARSYYRRRGVDTSAIWSGKASTFAAFVADGANMALGRQPVINGLVTVGKLTSAVHTLKEYERRRKELPELHHVRDIMLANQR